MNGRGEIFPIAGRCQSRAFQLQQGMLFGVAASKGFDEDLLEDDIVTHAKAAFARVREVLGEANLKPTDVAFVQVYLQDVQNHVAAFNSVWREFFKGCSPARCCTGAGLQPGILVEMVFVAQRSGD